MKLGLVGLGKMGSQIANKLLDSGGHELVVDSRHEENTRPLTERGAAAFSDYADLANQLKDETAVVWLMIPHQYVAEEISKLLEVLPKDSIIIDGGNSRYTSTIEQGQRCNEHDIELVDVGTSGGVWGEQRGFSMMVGGDKSAVDYIAPILDTLAGPEAAWYRFGRTGAGHFVKMVHNGVEYGIMQAYAEGYRILKEGPIEDIELDKVADVWQHKSINESFLNGLIRDMLARDPNLGDVAGVVAESGEARWTLETADELGIPAPVIKAALDVRLQSQNGHVNYATKFLAQLRNEFGGHDVNPKQNR